MESSEIFHSKEKFENKVLEAFAFLTTNLGYNQPEILSKESEYRQIVVYKNISSRNAIEILNAYHPVDYGFEVNLYDINDAEELINQQMIYNRLKEDQKPDLEFVDIGAQMLKNRKI